MEEFGFPLSVTQGAACVHTDGRDICEASCTGQCLWANVYKVLRGAISTKEWARFDWYALKVRKFSYTRDPDSLDIAMHVYFRLAQLRSAPILPSLRHLHCPSTNQSDFLISGICLFLSPSLQTLELGGITAVEDKLCGTILYTLFSDGAQMEKIYLRGKGLSRETLHMAIQFEHLRELELQGMGKTLDMEVLEQIGRLPWLVDLAIDFTNSLIPHLNEDIGLRNLTSLMVTAPISFIFAFLPHIATTTLETFFAIAPTTDANKTVFLQDVVTRWRGTLRRIALVHQPGQQEVTVDELTLAALAPLLPLKKLTYLRLEGYAMELSDTNIDNFALAWPNMNTLLLPFISAGHVRPTIKSLYTLARRLPGLRHLRIPLNTGELSAFVSTGMPHTPVHALHTLTIASADDPWELRDLLHLARHIDYFFPRLRYVCPYEAHDVDRWLQVHEMIQMYQAVRKEAVAFERARLTGALW